MKLIDNLHKIYSTDSLTAQKAQELAHIYSWGPMVFQTARLMVHYGILRMLGDAEDGLTAIQIEEQTHLSNYAVKCLMEAALTMRLVLIDDNDQFHLSKVGWFLENDALIRADIDFNHDVNYRGMFYLQDAFEQGKPAGLKTLGNWPTIYEGLSSLAPQVQRSWFGFDHFYSDHSFDEAIAIICAQRSGAAPLNVMDVGGNTGRFALQCVKADEHVHVTICDLPQQIGLMREATRGQQGAERIHGVGMDLLDETQAFPVDKHYDVIWMSQFLDCFSGPQIISILRRVSTIMDETSRIFIMETLWDRQKYAPAAFCLTQASLYFTAMANGNSKMYNTDDMTKFIHEADLSIETMHDNIGKGGHTILVVKKK